MEQFPEKGKQTEQGRQQRETAVAILNVGGGDDAVQQQALRIDQNMPLLALDQLAGIEAQWPSLLAQSKGTLRIR